MKMFTADNYRPDHALCYKPFFEWQFQVKKNKGYASIICAYQDNRLIGICGYLPLELHWGTLTGKTTGAWLLNWMVSSESPKGLGSIMLMRLQKMFGLCLTLNSSQFGTPILQAFNWKYFNRLPRYIIVMDKNACTPLLYDGVLPGRLDSYIFDEGKLSLSPANCYAESFLSDENYTPDWEFYPAMCYGTVRSLSYFRWRYMEHPSFKYYFRKSDSKTRPAVCVFRLEESFGSAVVKVARIVDFFYPPDEQGRADGMAVLASVLSFCRERGCVYVEFKCSRREYLQTFMALGGKEEPEEHGLLVSRLAPVQYLHRNTNVSYLSKMKNHQPELDQMYITKSDVDDDAPSSISAASRLVETC
jgi:hypothetical protein